MEHSVWINFPRYNESPANCSDDPYRASCFIAQDERAKRDLVALVRGIVSILSLLGSLSIIISVILKRQIFSPKVHPIFMLSIADCLLSVLWLVGGALWLWGGVSQPDSERVGCFTVMLFTVIMECVVVNLTLVYALLAYSNIKQKDFNNVYLLFNRDREVQAWKIWKTILAYILAWLVPAILILVPFSALASSFHIVKHANSCSCWCLPYYGNVLPLAFPSDKPTAHYLQRLDIIIEMYGSVVGAHYLIGFIFLVITYWKILKQIKMMRHTRTNHNRTSTQTVYGTTDQGVIRRGESQAKARVVYFLTVFVVVGFFNTILSFAFVGSEIVDLTQGAQVSTSPEDNDLPNWQLGLYLLQSTTLPLQGFLNAIVYGWTRGDFLQVMATNSNNSIQNLPPNLAHDDEGDEDSDYSYSGLVSSGSIQTNEQTGIAGEYKDLVRDYSQRSHDRSHDRSQDPNISLLSPGPLDTVDEVTEPEDNDQSCSIRLNDSTENIH